jgi:hypothetical protein
MAIKEGLVVWFIAKVFVQYMKQRNNLPKLTKGM